MILASRRLVIRQALLQRWIHFPSSLVKLRVLFLFTPFLIDFAVLVVDITVGLGQAFAEQGQ
uniref:Uncharacterized protein n=1 Tax=Solanum lycopersicum TaxID=4081 RepID=A0A3Q7F1W8_SOLLC